MILEDILSAFEEALELEGELGTRTVELDRALLRPLETCAYKPEAVEEVASPSVAKAADKQEYDGAGALVGSGDSSAKPLADFAFLLECDPDGPVAELLPRISAAMGYGQDGVRINDPSARVLLVLGLEALRKWLPGVLARPGQWVKRGETPALVTISPVKTFRFYGHDQGRIVQLKRRLRDDLTAAMARLGKVPQWQKGK